MNNHERGLFWGLLAFLALVYGLCGYIMVEHVKAEVELVISVTPQTLMEGGAVQVTCHVTRNERNRWIDLGIYNYTGSGLQIDPSSDRTIWEEVFERVPCGVDTAFCEIEQAGGRVVRDTAIIQVAGCQEKRR